MYLIDRIANEDKPEMELVGADGNANAIIGRVMSVWNRARFVRDSEGNQISGRDVANEYIKRVTAPGKDYNHLVSLAWYYTREPECEEEEESIFDDYDEEMEDEDEYEEEIVEVEEEVNYE